jgi:F-type H+-transporting ATPase subunit gamma
MSPDDHPLLARHRSVDKALMVVFTSEKGLCGGFNSGVNRKAMDWMSRNSNKYKRVQMSFCGRKGFLFFKNRFEVASHYEDYALKPKFADALRIGNDLQKAFLSGQFDEIYVAYNALQGTLSYKPEVKKLLPLDTDVLPASPEAGKGMWIMEPSRRKLLLSAIPRVVNLKIYSIMVETAAGEHGARMAAMDNATRNADDLIENITLFRNRARQAKITKELTEIVGGAEALK